MAFSPMTHGKAVRQPRFALYAGALVLLGYGLVRAAPGETWFVLAVLATAGLAGWTALEYALHRFVLHGVWPFREWHREHHRCPAAPMGTPAILSTTLMAAFVFLPGLLLGDAWRACALTLGLSTGYFLYTVTHHAIHHGRAGHAWIGQRRRWHVAHHDGAPRAFYGITTAFCDRLFGTVREAGSPNR